MTCVSRSTLTSLLLLALVFLAGAASAQTVGGFQIVSRTRVNATTLEITYRASLTNGGQAIQSATATVVPSPDFQIIDGQLTFGPAGAGAVVPSADTFTLRQSPLAATRAPSFSFNVVVQPEGGGQGGEAVKLRVRPVANVRAGDPITVVVEALDANDVLDPNFAGPVTLANLQAAVPAFGQTSFDAPVVPVINGGLATFTGLSISNAADGYTFSALATLGGNAVVDSIDAGFNVTARQAVVSTVVANHRAGTAFGATVEARDANNSLAENFTGNVNVNAAAIGGSNFTGGQQTAAAVGGAATFAGLALNNAADSYAVTASAAGLLDGVSNSFNVSFNTLSVLAVASVRSGDPFNVQVEARDANGNLAENFGSSLGNGNDLALTNLQAAVVVNGQTSFNGAVVPAFGGGVATFTGLAINNAADGYTFGAQATSGASPVADAIDAGFNVTARQAVVSTVVANHRAGTAFGATVEARDANNSLAENFAGNVNVNAAAIGGSNFTGGQQTAAAVGGAATFAGLALNNAADSYAVTASAAGLLDGVSNSFNVSFNTLSVLAVASVRSGDPFNVQVEARDANGNLAENFGSSLGNGNDLALANLRAAVVVNGQTSFNGAVVPAFGGGVATFTGLAINNAADGYTFGAQATSGASPVVDAIDAGFNVTARLLTITTAVANHAAGTPFGLTAEARDNSNGLAENFGGNVSVDAAAAGGSNFDGGQKTVAAVAGVASFAGLVLSNDADGYVITASAAGLISGVSNAFNVTGGGGGGGEAQSLELSLNQSAIGAGGTADIFALVRDDLDEPIVPAPNVNYQIIADEGASGALPTVLNGVIQTSANTRGGFILHGQVDGTAVTDDVFFAVIQNAAQSANAGKFVALAAAEGTIATKLTELVDAFENDPAAIPAIKTALQNAMNSVPTTGRDAIQRSRPVAPEAGFLPTSAQLTAGGFPVTAADTTFGTVIGNIVTKLNQVKAFYDALPTNPASGAADSVAQLNQLNTDLAALQAQLEGLDITPQAIVLHTAKINDLIRLTMPLQMKSVAGKINGILTANALAGLQSTPEEFFDGTHPADASLAFAPEAFYGEEQPAFFGLVGMFAGSSIQMNLVNRIYGPVLAQVSRMMVILAVNGLLQEYVNPASLVTLITGASQSIHIYNAAGSVIEGFGINSNVSSNEVFLIGGGAVAAVEGLLDAFNPSNIDSFDDIDDYFEGIVDALEGAGEAYDTAEQPPDGVAFGCIFDDSPGCSELVFNNGFESVASCSGFFCFDFTVIVLYHNKDTGHWASQLVSFDP